MSHAQTWDLLAEALAEIRYTRDEKPDSDRFRLHRDDEHNRIAAIELHETCEDPYSFWPGGTTEQKSKAPGED